MVQRMVVARHACLKVAPSTSIVVASESEAISGRHSLDRSGLRRRASAPNKKKEHNLATMRRGYPAFFVQGGSAAGRWETRKDRTRLALGPWAGSPSPGPSPHKRPGAGGGSRAGQRVPGR